MSLAMDAAGTRTGVYALFLAVCVTLPAASLFAGGKAETAEPTVHNSEWTLCVTEFDISALPPSRTVMGAVITRNLVNHFRTVSYRLRISPEYAFYEGYLWNRAVTDAAKKIAAKQDERAQLLYRGEPEWKYRQNLKKTDGEIKKLREDLEKVEAEKPLVSREPAFTLTQGNRDGAFPQPPKKGGEYRFCKSQNADAFLSGSIREYHGRCYVELRLYTLYTRSFVYEDSVIFSVEDADTAVDEIAGALTAVLAGNKPAALSVRTEPEDALVLINKNFAGRGAVEIREHPPGKVVVAVSAEDRSPQAIETELVPGELTEIAVALSPVLYGDVNIDAPGKSAVSVYQGALYVGEAPLTLRLPLNRLDYLTVQTRGGETGGAVFTSPGAPDDSFTVSLKTKVPFPTGKRRVNRARYWYYWAWGGTWITGITAWVTYGIYSTQNSALPESINLDFYSETERMYYISTGATILVGAAIAYEIFQMVRYLYTATEDTTPIVKPGKGKKKK